MMAPVIQFKNVSKKFKMVRDRSHSFQEAFVNIFRQNTNTTNDYWALKDISFKIEQGESVAIVGSNGTGKSTVLKLISQILYPTSGKMMVNGRISSLLELGTGFHPDLAGRENIYMNGSMLGLSRQDVDDKYDDILAFSEMADFIDVPVKHYSSGMYLRLAFSVAIHVEPDILLVDEALAVGDYVFQQRCLERIGKLKRAGTTIILVSHNLPTILNLCERVIWLRDGLVHMDGAAGKVVDAYQSFSNDVYYENWGDKKGKDERLSEKRWGTFDAEIIKVEFLNDANESPLFFTTNEYFKLRVHYKSSVRIEMPAFGLAFYREDGIHINGPNSMRDGFDIPYIEGEGFIDYIAEQLPLNSGRYELTIALFDYYSVTAFDYHHRAYSFNVQTPATWQEEGVIHINAKWEHTVRRTGAKQTSKIAGRA